MSRLLLVLSLTLLLVGMWAGMVRIGWPLATLHAALPAAHGPVMVAGFLGTIISLERAVALGGRWTLLAPLLIGPGAFLAHAGIGGALGAILITLGSLVLLAIFGVIIRRQPALFTVAMGLGALAWLGGNAAWLSGTPLRQVALLWASFPVMTIAGERLELSRLTRPSKWSQRALLAAASLLLAGGTLAILDDGVGARVSGVGLLGMTAWLLRYDVVRYTIRQPGHYRFTAICLLTGYLWLGIAGLLWVAFGLSAGLSYDAALHALFLGFVFGMIFGHAPIVLPGVLGRRLPFRPAFYIHVAALHASLVLRIAGDLAGSSAARRWGGLFTVAALLLFLLITAWALLSARREPIRVA